MSEYAAAAFTREVEIRMVREVHDRRGVTTGIERDFEPAIVIPVVHDFASQFAGITFVAIRACEREYHAVCLHPAAPNPVSESSGTTVEVVGAIILCQTVFLSVERKDPPGDTVPVPSDDFAHGRTVIEITVESLIPQDYVGQMAGVVGDGDCRDGSPDVGETHRGAVRVGHRVVHDSLAFRGETPYVLCDFGSHRTISKGWRGNDLHRREPVFWQRRRGGLLCR